MDQDATRYGGRPRPRRQCVRWGPSSHFESREPLPQIFGPCLLWPKGWVDQDAHGMEVGLSPSDFVLDGDPVTSPKRRRSPRPKFSAHFYCGQTAECIKMPLDFESRDPALQSRHPDLRSRDPQSGSRLSKSGSRVIKSGS